VALVVVDQVPVLVAVVQILVPEAAVLVLVSEAVAAVAKLVAAADRVESVVAAAELAWTAAVAEQAGAELAQVVVAAPITFPTHRAATLFALRLSWNEAFWVCLPKYSHLRLSVA
jgi:hypothetical protein